MTEKKTMAPRDLVLLIALLLMLTSVLYSLTIIAIGLVNHQMASQSYTVYVIIRLVLALIPIGLAFTMRNLALKISAFVVTGIYLALIILDVARVI